MGPRELPTSATMAEELLTPFMPLGPDSREGSGAQGGDDEVMDLPSAPRRGLVSAPSDASTEATMDASGDYGDESLLPEGRQPRFARGQKVLYDSFQQALPVRGTVAKMDCGGEFAASCNCSSHCNSRRAVE